MHFGPKPVLGELLDDLVGGLAVLRSLEDGLGEDGERGGEFLVGLDSLGRSLSSTPQPFLKVGSLPFIRLVNFIRGIHAVEKGNSPVDIPCYITVNRQLDVKTLHGVMFPRGVLFIPRPLHQPSEAFLDVVDSGAQTPVPHLRNDEEFLHVPGAAALILIEESVVEARDGEGVPLLLSSMIHKIQLVDAMEELGDAAVPYAHGELEMVSDIAQGRLIALLLSLAILTLLDFLGCIDSRGRSSCSSGVVVSNEVTFVAFVVLPEGVRLHSTTAAKCTGFAFYKQKQFHLSFVAFGAVVRQTSFVAREALAILRE